MTLRATDRLALDHGACVVVELDDSTAALAAVRARLAPAEQQRADELGPYRGRDYIAGRTALHLAIDPLIDSQAGLQAGLQAAAPPGPAQAILSDDRGAPILPAGWVGSVSHKGVFAAALVAPAGAGHLGIDVEAAAPPRLDIAPRILTPRELAALPDRDRGVTLRFSLKEAIYKAIDPFVRRYVGFLEVELEFAPEALAAGGLDAGGEVRVTTALPLAIAASWRVHAGHWLSTARATRR